MAGSVSRDAETQMTEDSSTKRRGGGWITFPFMIATLLGLTIAAWGWLLNLIVYLIEEFNVKSIAAAQIANIVSGCICMVPAVGAIAADSFFGTIPVISVSAFLSLAGVSLLTLTAALDSLRPSPCDTTTASSSLCQSPSKLQLGVLYTAITLASIGTGGSRFTLATAGANQYEKTKDQGSFFNWFFFTTYLAGAISATAVVYSEDNVSWTFGFGLCVAANLLSFLVFILGRRFYKHDKPLGSPFTSLLRVVFAAVIKRKAVVSISEKDYHSESPPLSLPTKSLRFFNRAALKQEDEVKPDGTVHNLWRLCSVQQVEDFKAVIRIIPLALATIFLSTPIAMQLSLTVLQGLVMDRRLGPNFKIPAGSLQVITLLSTCLFIIVNDRFLYPFYQKLTGKFLTPLQRVGIGHVFNILSMAVTAIVEAKRLKIVEKGDFLESSSIAEMSVLWLFPPLVIVGIGEAFHFPGNVALCYQEFPESMRSTATSITSVVIGICFYTSTALIDLIQRTTAWLPDDINHGRVDNVYWVLVIGGVLNLGYFLVCSWLYKYRNLEDDGHEKDVAVSHSATLST
ncbi:Protein NRT1/ PTR FAMILY 2.7 [Hirschfeldia incana]|nr:Protein NRT1/ PTR FAMILY 2.7 [Hirschfeldia incana]